MKIIDYKLVTIRSDVGWSEYVSDIVKRVKKDIEDGWQPFGTIPSIPAGINEYRMQHMVKYESNY